MKLHNFAKINSVLWLIGLLLVIALVFPFTPYLFHLVDVFLSITKVFTDYINGWLPKNFVDYVNGWIRLFFNLF